MGMFDTVRCQFPLPVNGANALAYQTKDLECDLCEYRIGPDGQLWQSLYEWDAEKQEQKIVGEQHTKWSGSMNFYSSFDDYRRGGWIEFQAHFVDGKMTHIHLVENRSASDALKNV